MIKIKANNGGNTYGYLISEVQWMEVAKTVFLETQKEQSEKVKEPLKMGGAISQFLHAYGVTGEQDEKSVLAGNASAFPANGGEFESADWLTAWNHSEGRSAGLATRQATWDRKAADLRGGGLKPEDFIGKRPEAKA